MSKLNQLREQLKTLKVDALLITSAPNRRYVTGFTGSSGWVYISSKRAVLMTDFRYIEQATAQAEPFEIINHGNQGLIKTLAEIIEVDGVQAIGFESEQMTYKQYQKLADEVAVHFVPTEKVVEMLRQVKTQDEIEKLAQAEHIGDKAFSHILSYIKEKGAATLSENDIALEIEHFMRAQGATGNSFSPIIATGAHSSLCHAEPDDRKLENNGFVVMDFGCIYEGYCSDMTRTIFIGEISDKQKEIYDVVLQAQQAALDAIRPGMTGKDVDHVARDIITQAGYGDYFGHGLGHGVGLEIHEAPRFSSQDETIIKPGMVMTVEPGIYIPGLGGVRIEDMVVVTEDGIRNLTSSDKSLVCID